jgi:hypothetical protein
MMANVLPGIPLETRADNAGGAASPRKNAEGTERIPPGIVILLSRVETDVTEQAGADDRLFMRWRLEFAYRHGLRRL